MMRADLCGGPAAGVDSARAAAYIEGTFEA
jgi:hypothetical protein